jgi:hypothetical protein
MSSPAIARLASESPITGVPMTKAVFHEHNIGAALGSLHAHGTHQGRRSYEHPAAIRSAAAARNAGRSRTNVYSAAVRNVGVDSAQVRATQVRLTRGDLAPVAFTETLFVVFENGSSGSPDRPVFQIQMWRVMVLHPVVDPSSNGNPAKQT